jgi:hypothetical protein
MFRGIILISLILGTLVQASKNDKFGFDDFLDSIGDAVENIDFSSMFGSSDSNHHSDNDDNRDSYSYSYSHRNNLNGRIHYYYTNNDWMNTYFNIRLIDSLFPPSNYKPGTNQPINITLDPILKYPIITIFSVSLSMIIIFLLLDCYKQRYPKWKRIRNLIIIGIISIIGWFKFYIVCHIIKYLFVTSIPLFPYFLQFFLGTTGALFFIYFIIIMYKRSNYRITRKLDEHII